MSIIAVVIVAAVCLVVGFIVGVVLAMTAVADTDYDSRGRR